MKPSHPELHIDEITAQNTNLYWIWNLTSTQTAIPIASLQSIQTEIPLRVTWWLCAALLLLRHNPGPSAWDWLHNNPREITFPKSKQAFVNTSFSPVLLPVSFLMSQTHIFALKSRPKVEMAQVMAAVAAARANFW